MTLVRRTIPMVLLIMSMGLLGRPHVPIFGQTPSTDIPHLAYGESLTLTSPTFVWLDVVQGDMFTFTATGVEIDTEPLRSSLNDPPPAVFDWQQLPDGYIVVYHAEQPGPYLWTFAGGGQATITLEQGDTIDIDRGQIAIGETVTGTGSGGPMNVYTIDLDADITLRLTGVCDPGLGAFLYGADMAQPLIFSDAGGLSYYFAIPPDLAGPYQLYIRCSSGEYSLRVTASNDVWLDRGPLTLDAPISGANTAAFYDHYQLDLEQGDLVTVWVQSAGDGGINMDAYDGTGTYLVRGESGRTETGYYSTYWAKGEGPYALYIWMEQPYTISMTSGMDLTDDQLVRIGETVELSLDISSGIPDSGHAWLVDVPDGTWVTLQTKRLDSTAGVVDVELVDAIGRSVIAVARFRDSTGYGASFYLTGPGPYRVSSMMPVVQNYSLTVTEGEHLILDRGAIEVGQLVEDTAEVMRTLHYTLAATPPGQMYVKTSGVSHFSVTDADGKLVESFYANGIAASPDNPYIMYAAYQLDGACPCQIELLTSEPNYTLEVAPVPEGAFPDAQPLNLGEAVHGETDDEWMLTYTFEVTNYVDLAVRLEFDPTQTDANALYIETRYPGQRFPGAYMPDQNRTEHGENYIVLHYVIFFPGEYTLRIINLHGPYTLTVDVQ